MKVCPLNDFAETFSSVQFSSSSADPCYDDQESRQDEQEVVPDLLLSGGREMRWARSTLIKAEHLVGSGREHGG